MKVPCIPACAGGHPPTCWGLTRGRSNSQTAPPFFQQPSTGQVRQAQGKTQDEAGFPSPATHGQAEQQTRTGQCGEGAARDTPGCSGRGREGVKANCLEAGRAPGRLSWRGSQMEKPGDGGWEKSVVTNVCDINPLHPQT